jgi:mono/diheme cytochrome c family protein
MRACLLALALVGLSACASAQSEHQALAEDGREIAIAQCARCHAVGSYGQSAMPGAQPFRTILGRYRPDVLEEELIAGIRVSHRMPDFQFNPQGVDALIAYLRTIQEPTSAPSP